jgi:hypothetical protein
MAPDIHVVPFLKFEDLRLVTPAPDACVPEGVTVLGYLEVGIHHDTRLFDVLYTVYQVLGSQFRSIKVNRCRQAMEGGRGYNWVTCIQELHR